MTKNRILLLVAGLLVVGGAAAYVPIQQAREQAAIEERFEKRLEHLEKGSPRVVSDTVTAVEAESRFLNDRARVLELAETVANRELLDDEESLQSSQKFWLLMQNAEPLREHEFLPEAFSKIRHSGFLVKSRIGSLELYQATEAGKYHVPLHRFVKEVLSTYFPGAERDENTTLLWDRINLEEMSGDTAAARQSLELLNFDKVQKHWEIQADANWYVIMRTDLKGRIRRKMATSKQLSTDGSAEEDLTAFDLENDKEVVSFLGQESEIAKERYHKKRLFNLLKGIEAFHTGDVPSAISLLDGFFAGNEQGGAVVKPVSWHAAIYFRALAHLEAARQLYRDIQEPVAQHERSSLSPNRMELRLAQYYAELFKTTEFDAVLDDYFFAPERSERPLLLHLRTMLWSGDAARSAEAQASIGKIIEKEPEILHTDDIEWWAEVARGEVPAAGEEVLTLYRIGLIYEELHSLDRLEQTIEDMKFSIENEVQQGYLYLLTALLHLKRGNVVEASRSLEMLLHKQVPDVIDSDFLDALVEEIEIIQHKQEEIRKHLVKAEKPLREIYVLRQGLHPDLILAAGATLLLLQFEAPLMYSDPDWKIFHGQKTLLSDVLESFDQYNRYGQLSYFLDRLWLDLRDSAIRYFYEHYRRKDYERALEQLQLVGQIQKDQLGTQFLEQMGLVYRDWATALGEKLAGSTEREALRTYWRRAGENYEAAYRLNRQNKSAQNEAVFAFRNAGDPAGLLRVADGGNIVMEDRRVLLAVGQAQIQTVNYRDGIQTLDRFINITWNADIPKEEPSTPIARGAFFPSDIPAELDEWLEIGDIIDPLNGLGLGRLFFSASKQGLRWQAPSDVEPGPEVVVEQGDRVRLLSRDVRKSLLVTVRQSLAEDNFPDRDASWNVQVMRRDFPLGRQQAQVYLWKSLGQIQLARLPLIRGPSDALRFVSDHLRPRGDFEVQFGLRNLLDDIVRKAYATAETRTEIQSSLQPILQLRDKRLHDQRRLRRNGRDNQSEALTNKLESLAHLMAGLDKADGALRLIGFRDQEIQDALQGFYLSLFDRWVVDEGAPALALLEELERARLDRDARSALLLLNQNFDYRDEIWQGAMYLRALQLVRQAEERRSRPADAPEVARDDRKPTPLEAEARELLTRLIEAPGDFYSVRWTPRGLTLLGSLWTRTGDWDQARKTYRRIIDLDLNVRNRDLTDMETVEIEELVRSAYLALADATYMEGKDYNQALVEYKRAADIHIDSPKVLWARYQLGNCYSLTDQDVDALREFQSGRSLVGKFFTSKTTASTHWLTGVELSPDRRKVLEDILTDTGGKVPAALAGGAGDAPRFWAQLFDAKIQYLNDQILKSTAAGQNN